MHSTPKYGRDLCDSRVSSYLPGELRRCIKNDLSNVTEQVSSKENISVRSGASGSVSQQVASSNESALRGIELASDGGRKDLRSEQRIRAIGDEINSRRTSGSSLLEEDKLRGESSRSVLMETITSRYTSDASKGDKYGGPKSIDHSTVSKPANLGFQYEDIQSFRDRQKIEGDGLQLHRRRLSGNIVGTVKKGDLPRDIITSGHSGYSGGIAADLEKPGDRKGRHYSSVHEYKSYGTSHDDILARDKILGNDKSDGESDRSNSDVDRARLSGDVKPSSTAASTHLHKHSSDHDHKTSSSTDTAVPRDERFSKTDDLVAKYLDSSRHKSKRGSDLDFEHKHLSSLTEITEEDKEDGRRKEGKDSTGEKHHSVSRKPMRYPPNHSSYEELLKKKKDVSSHSSEPSSVLDKNHDISSHSKFTYGNVSNKIDRRSDFKDSTYGNIPGNKPGIGGKDYFRRRTSYDWLDNEKARETEIGGGPEISMQGDVDDSPRKSEVSHRRISSRTFSDLELDGKHTSDVDNDRSRVMDGERAKAMSPDDRLKYQNKDMPRTRYQTPYTSLDHSHHKPTPFIKRNVDDDHIYAVPIKKSERGQQVVSDKRGGDSSENTKSHKPEDVPREGIYDKLVRRGSGPLEKTKTDTRTSGLDNRHGSFEGLDKPVYEWLYLSSDPESRPPKERHSPVSMSAGFGLPLDKYDRPVPLHGKTKELANREEIFSGREIVSKCPERQLFDRPRGADFSDLMTGEHTNVKETTRTSVMQRRFVAHNGEVVKDEVKHHDEVRHGGKNAIERIEEKYSSPEMPTRGQRYPAVKREEVEKDVLKTDPDSRKIEDVRRLRDTKEPKGTDKTKCVTPSDNNLDEIMKLTGLDDADGVTNYQERTRWDDVTHIQDDSNFRTKVHRTDVNTNVNNVREIAAPKKDKPTKSNIANLSSKIEALTKSVDEIMDLKRKTVLQSCVKEHVERRSSKDIEEPLPKIERYDVKSKRHEPRNIELNIKSLWLSEEQQAGKDIDLHIPKEIYLAHENRTLEWWNAATAGDADRFICIGDWKWWNANTTEGVDHILGIQAINSETGATGAIIAKYQGEEQPLQWAWFEAANQPSDADKRRNMTRVFIENKENQDSTMWDSKTTADGTYQHLDMGDLQWWNATTEGVNQILGVRGSDKETRTILATYDEGAKPKAWTWVQTSQKVPEVRVEKNHTLTRSSRDIYVDETENGKVELLIRIQDEETQDPRYIAVRPGPVEKAIIVHQAVESEMPYISNLLVKGQQGEGLQVKNGVVQIKMKNLTPEAREALLHIIGMEDRNFKLLEDETFEIPVRVVDKPRRVKSKEDIYAVPIKKNKRKPLDSTRPVKSVHIEEKGKLEEKKSGGFDKKKKEKKESDSEKKKRESKLKKLEAEKKKKEEAEKKKKKKEKMKLEKERESERIKEKEMEKKRKEQQKKKEVGSVKKEKVAVVKGGKPPPVDRSTKPKPKMVEEIYSQDIRRHSDVVDAGMGQRREHFERGNSNRKSYVEVSTRHYGSVPNIRVDKSSKSVVKIEERGGNLTRKASPSAKVVKHVSVTQSGKTRPYSVDQTDSIKHKSGSLQRRSTGSSIAVPLRGGASKQTNGSVKVISQQNVQNQKPPQQNIRQTTVQESNSHRTKTHITSDDERSNAVLPHIGAGQVGPGHIFETEQIGEGYIGAGHFGVNPVDGGQGHVGGNYIGAHDDVIGHVRAGNFGLHHVGEGHVEVLHNMPTKSSTDYS